MGGGGTEAASVCAEDSWHLLMCEYHTLTSILFPLVLLVEKLPPLCVVHFFLLSCKITKLCLLHIQQIFFCCKKAELVDFRQTVHCLHALTPIQLISADLALHRQDYFLLLLFRLGIYFYKLFSLCAPRPVHTCL